MSNASNKDPLFVKTPNNGSPVNLTVANTSSQGGGTLGTDIFKLFTAGANDSVVYDITFMPTASVASSATTATTARIFLSTVGTGATTVNDTHLIAEVPLNAITADHPTIQVTPVVVSLNRTLKSGEYIHVSTHVAAAANTSWKAVARGGDF